MRELEYQTKVLDALNEYLDVLKGEKVKADAVEALKVQQPDLPIPSVDFAKATWYTPQGSRQAAPVTRRISALRAI
ncbi:hypothetical protein [Octadecabacter antarcticus]|uniref:hypothetical protein n=1 Tax=Octadecabacter antarcticus TaxID=1217908 RepID=UPI00018071DE|nr:hypothetical protein [Octadecabacter antarcticus]